MRRKNVPRLDGAVTPPPLLQARALLLIGVCWAVRSVIPPLLVLTRVLVTKDIAMNSKMLREPAAVFAGSALGSAVAGVLTDIYGRKLTVILSMSLSLIGLAATAFATDHDELVHGHFITGIGLGGELPSAVLLLFELAPQSARGGVVALLGVFAGIGAMISVGLAMALGPAIGWRQLYLATSAVAALHIGALYWWVPESPRWVASLATSESGAGDYPHYRRREVGGWRLLLTKYKLTTLRLIVLWTALGTASYAFTTFIPTLISLESFKVFGTWEAMMMLHVAEVVGGSVCAYLITRRGSARTLTMFSLLTVVNVVVLVYSPWTATTILVGSAFVFMTVTGMLSSAFASIPGEYPTLIRGRSVGVVFAISCATNAAGVHLYPYLYNVLLVSTQTIMWVVAALLLATILLCVDSKRRARFVKTGSGELLWSPTASEGDNDGKEERVFPTAPVMHGDGDQLTQSLLLHEY